MRQPITLSSSQVLFSVPFLVFFFTLLNGYLQNLTLGYRADAWLVLAGVIIEMAMVLWLARGRVAVRWDWLELAGFTFVVAAVGAYLIAPSLPTLLPPTQSSDAVRVYLQVLFSYPEGKLVSWYPAGGAFVVAMVARWLGAEPLRVLHPTAAFILALCAGAVYGMAGALLPQKRASKIIALAAPALLFVPWSYFAGTINWEQYFFAQVFAQYWTLAALWFTASDAAQPHWIFAALLGAALLGIIAAYPIFVALPLGTFLLVALARWTRDPAQRRGAALALGIFLTLMLLAAIALQHGGILELAAGQKSATSDVGAGGVTNPSIETLGGPIFLALALVGIGLAWRETTARAFARTLLAFLSVWLLQLGALVVTRPFFQISGYRVDKTFYILIFPLALLATLALEKIISLFDRQRPTADGVAGFSLAGRRALLAFGLAALALSASVLAFRPPKVFAPFSESELRVAQWAKQHLDTYQINYLDPLPTRAYWLAFGLWRETLPNEWFQWIPAGTKLGPQHLDEWLNDPAWQSYLLVRATDLGARTLEALPVTIVYREGDSAIIRKEVAPQTEPQPMARANWDFVPTLRLVGYDLPRATFAPGGVISLTTHTRALAPPSATVAWRVELVDRAGKVLTKIERDPFDGKYPLQRWVPGRYARDDWSLALDARTPPGLYALQMSLFRREGGALVNVCPSGAPVTSATCFFAAPLATIKIPVAPPSEAELRAATPLGARVGENFRLASYALEIERAAPRVRVTLYWQSVAQTTRDYTVFVHLLDASGRVVAQQDAEPLDGRYPTSIWDVGEIVTEEYALAIPADARAPFAIEIGMYAQPDLRRLPVGATDHIVIPTE